MALAEGCPAAAGLRGVGRMIDIPAIAGMSTNTQRRCFNKFQESTMNPREFADKLFGIYGEKLVSVVLYGSAAGGNHSKKFSDYNVFCVLEKVTPSELMPAQKLIAKWVKQGNPTPLFFDPKHITSSLDVFPMEFLDMKDAHEVLAGKDPLQGLTVSVENLRRQCESELKGKIIQLRSFFSLMSNKPKEIARAMVRSFPSFLTCMRTILRLGDKKLPADARAVVEEACIVSNINPEVFFEVIAIRRGESLLPRRDDAIAMFEQYLTELQSLADFVDKFEG